LTIRLRMASGSMPFAADAFGATPPFPPWLLPLGDLWGCWPCAPTVEEALGAAAAEDGPADPPEGAFGSCADIFRDRGSKGTSHTKRVHDRCVWQTNDLVICISNCPTKLCVSLMSLAAHDRSAFQERYCLVSSDCVLCVFVFLFEGRVFVRQWNVCMVARAFLPFFQSPVARLGTTSEKC
jgi:hypothetical protein